jgi:hypothetical protein
MLGSARKSVGFTFCHLLSTLLDNQLIEPELLSCALQHSLFDTAFGDESEDEYLFGLANAVGAVHCLEVSLWIPVPLSEPESWGRLVSLPITVIEDDNISTRQVDTQTAGASGKQEDKFVAPLFVVIVDGLNTVFVGGASINPAVL